MDHLKRNRWLNPFALTLIFAFLLRMWDVNARSLWFDEAFEYWSAVIPHHLIPRTVLTSYQPPLYTIILHFWLQFGDSATWMRLLSVFLSLLCLTGVVGLAWRAVGKKGALIAAILMAILPSEIRYAQEVGEYALMECCLAWSIYFLFRASQRPSYRYFAAWAVCSVLAIYSHYGAAVVIIPTTAALLVENALRRKWRSIARQIACFPGSLAVWNPVIGLFLAQANCCSSTGEGCPFHRHFFRDRQAGRHSTGYIYVSNQRLAVFQSFANPGCYTDLRVPCDILAGFAGETTRGPDACPCLVLGLFCILFPAYPHGKVCIMGISGSAI